MEIYDRRDYLKHHGGRTSHEVRGLKLLNIRRIHYDNMSHLTRGAWIEINEELLKLCAL